MGLPLYTRRPFSSACTLEESSCSGRLTTLCRALTTCGIRAGSSTPGAPTFTSSTCAPASTWLTACSRNIVHIILPQCLLEALFAGGVDALAHHGDAVHVDIIHGGAQHRGHGVGRAARHTALEHPVQQPDELRRGAAAAAGGKQIQLR